MKKTILLFLLAFIGLSTANAQVGIGTTEPHASSILDVVSDTKGFLPPRLTTDQRDEINLPDGPTPGLVIYNETVNCLQWFNGTGWFDACDGTITGPPIASGACAGEPTFFTFNGKEYRPVVSSGKCWLDRNLGANQVATSSTDAAAYGDLYQWGRRADGHQLRTSSNTAVNATVNTDTPPHGDFIITNTSPFDWRIPQNDLLWQGAGGTNNPCPTGYRLPTETELNNERLSWVQAPISSTNTSAGAFASPLKLTMAGYRSYSVGSIVNVDTGGYYWTSTITTTNSRYLVYNDGGAQMSTAGGRANGFPVRCLKD